MKDHRYSHRQEHIAYEDRRRKLGLFKFNRKLREILLKFLIGIEGIEKTKRASSQRCTQERGNGHKLLHQKSIRRYTCTSYKEKNFAMRVVKP